LRGKKREGGAESKKEMKVIMQSGARILKK